MQVPGYPPRQARLPFRQGRIIWKKPEAKELTAKQTWRQGGYVEDVRAEKRAHEMTRLADPRQDSLLGQVSGTNFGLYLYSGGLVDEFLPSQSSPCGYYDKYLYTKYQKPNRLTVQLPSYFYGVIVMAFHCRLYRCDQG